MDPWSLIPSARSNAQQLFKPNQRRESASDPRPDCNCRPTLVPQISAARQIQIKINLTVSRPSSVYRQASKLRSFSATFRNPLASAASYHNFHSWTRNICRLNQHANSLNLQASEYLNAHMKYQSSLELSSPNPVCTNYLTFKL